MSYGFMDLLGDVSAGLDSIDRSLEMHEMRESAALAQTLATNSMKVSAEIAAREGAEAINRSMEASIISDLAYQAEVDRGRYLLEQADYEISHHKPTTHTGKSLNDIILESKEFDMGAYAATRAAMRRSERQKIVKWCIGVGVCIITVMMWRFVNV